MVMPSDLTPLGSTVDGESLEAILVFRSWLQEGGDPGVLRPFMTAWLQAHGERAEARLVFTAWLHAGGKNKVIRKSLYAWLSLHAADESARAVFLAWISTGANLGFIKKPVGRWLSAHPAHPAAAGLVSHLARQKDLPEETLQGIFSWCRENHPAEAVFSCLVNLEEHLLREEMAGEVVNVAASWLQTVLNQESLAPRAAALISLLFAILGESPKLRAELAPLFLEWLRHPSSYPAPSARSGMAVQRIYLGAQRLSILSYLDDLIASGQISVAGDRDVLRRLFAWVKTWTPEVRSQVGPFLGRWVDDAP